MPTKQIEFEGKTYPSVAALAKAFERPHDQVVKRLKAGYSIKQAIGKLPLDKRVAHNAISIWIAGEQFGSVRQAAKHFGIDEGPLSVGWN